MKTKALKFITLTLGLISLNSLKAQAPITTNPSPPGQSGTNDRSFWSRAGNTLANGTNNVFGFTALNNSTIWHQTNGFNRMLMMNGGQANNGGQIGIGNNLPSTFTPAARLHLHHSNAGAYVNMRMTTAATGPTNNDGFEIGMGNTGDVAFINHELNANFSWYNRGAGSGTLLARMRLYDGGTGQDKGRLAISNALPAAFVPTARLHIYQMLNDGLANGDMIRTDGLDNLLNQIQMFTGVDQNSLTEKFTLFIPPNKKEVGMQATDTDGFLFFNTGGANERFRIFNNTSSPSTPNGGGVGVDLVPGTPILQPGALLHIGEKFNTPITGLTGYFGWRSWMSVGTFDFSGTDNMYIGLKAEGAIDDNPGLQLLPPIGGADKQDAIINWGDNATSGNINPPVGPDYLRFINTQSYDPSALPSFPRHKDGLEVARFAPNSNFGIGNFYNNPLFTTKDPVRRLEVLSDKTLVDDDGTPQFRLTHTQQGNVLSPNLGKFTDFHTLHFGDLAIQTYDNTQTNTADKILKQRFVGINTNTPNNTLEINSQYVSAATLNNQPQDPTVALPPTGWAGLRFTDLNSTSIVQANPGTGVLSVNLNGDVVYVPGGAGSTALGNACGIPITNPLLTNWEIPLNDFNFVFKGQGVANNNVGIGTTCSPLAKLEVLQSSTNVGSTGVRVDNTDVLGIGVDVIANGPFAIRGLALMENPNSLVTTGIYGEASYASIKSNRGVHGTSNSSASTNIGGYFTAISSINSPGENFGVYSQAKGAQVNYGGRFHSSSLGSVANLGNYGIYATAGFAGSTVGNNTAIYGEVFDNSDVAAGFIGNVHVYSGDLDLHGGALLNQSDISLKTNIQTIQNASGLLESLNPTSFYYDTSRYFLRYNNGKQYGLIAQAVETVLPELVSSSLVPDKKDSIGNIIAVGGTYKNLNYQAFISILIKAHQEQQSVIDSLKTTNQSFESRLANIETMLNSCCQNQSTRTQTTSNPSNTVIDVELSDKDIIVLNQNVPNPFAEQTTITYNVPEKSSFAQIIFNDMKGQIIKVIDIKTKGKGQLNVFANDLSTGMYTYSLYVDGKLIDTKKMVKTE